MTRVSEKPGSAWDTAREYGVDVSAIEANLYYSVEERLQRHDRALNTIIQLRDAVRQTLQGKTRNSVNDRSS